MSLDLDINSLTVVAPVDVSNPFCSCIVFDTGTTNLLHFADRCKVI